MFVAMQGKIVESSFKGRPFRVNRASSDGPRLPRTSRACRVQMNADETRPSKGVSRRNGLVGATLGTFGAAALNNLVLPPAFAGDWVLFQGAQGELSPVSCTRPKDPTRAAPRGSTITMPQNFEFVDPCILGGTTLATPWSFWGPIALQPLTGFRDGTKALLDTSDLKVSPDPSGSMDARLESDYGIVLVSALPERAGDPWIGKEDVKDAGSPEDVLTALNPQLLRNLVNTSTDVDGNGTTYYTYELNNAATKFANRRVIKVAIGEGKLIAVDVRCNENQWARSEAVLKPIIASFRLGTTASPKPAV